MKIMKPTIKLEISHLDSLYMKELLTQTKDDIISNKSHEGKCYAHQVSMLRTVKTCLRQIDCGMSAKDFDDATEEHNDYISMYNEQELKKKNDNHI